MENIERPARQVARRHHTVPQFYLRGFAKVEQVTTVRLPGDQRFTQSVGDASVAKDYYSLDGDDILEKALSEIEGSTATVFNAINEGTWPLEYEDRMTVAYFVALQATRVLAQRRTMDHVARQMLRRPSRPASSRRAAVVAPANLGTRPVASEGAS
jgi:hypothetical protein